MSYVSEVFSSDARKPFCDDAGSRTLPVKTPFLTREAERLVGGASDAHRPNVAEGLVFVLPECRAGGIVDLHDRLKCSGALCQRVPVRDRVSSVSPLRSQSPNALQQ